MFDPPTGEIGNDFGRALKLQAGLDNDPPATARTATMLKFPESGGQHRFHESML